jgi:hypothetical protein
MYRSNTKMMYLNTCMCNISSKVYAIYHLFIVLQSTFIYSLLHILTGWVQWLKRHIIGNFAIILIYANLAQRLLEPWFVFLFYTTLKNCGSLLVNGLLWPLASILSVDTHFHASIIYSLFYNQHSFTHCFTNILTGWVQWLKRHIIGNFVTERAYNGSFGR